MMGAAGSGGISFNHWIATLGGSTTDEGYGVAIDSVGNIYICGTTINPADSTLDAFVAKYNTNGVIQWQRRLGGASSDYTYSIAVDSNSNVYIAGRTDSQGAGNSDALIAKYNDSGVIQWQRSLGGTSVDLANGIAVDGSGNAYIVGTTASQGAGGNDILVAKYNTSGVIQWQRSLGGTSGELGNAIAVDSSGNVYIAGYGSTQTAGNNDCIVAKYDTSGVIQWQRRLGGASAEFGNGIAVDSSGNVYISGANNSQSAGSSDALIAKYNTSGVIQWQRRLGGASSDNAYGIAVDAAGNAYIIGESNNNDLLLAKYNTSGAIQWQRAILGASNDYGRGVAVDTSGNIYIIGVTYSQGVGSGDFLIAKLPDDGSKIGTYGNLSYLPTTLTDAATTLTDAATTLTDAARSLTDAARTLTDAATTLTSTTITVGPSPDSNLPLVESVFSTLLYTGTGAVQGIGNGIDLAGKGGMVWIKGRSGTTGHRLTDTTRGATKSLESNSTVAEFTEDTGLNFFTSTGFALGNDFDYNTSAATYASWTFRKAEKFFTICTWTGNGSNRTVAHDLGSVPGCIIVKRTDTTSDWQVYHRSLANTEYLVLNSDAAKATGTTRWNSTTPTSTVFSLGTDATVNASGGTYVAYLFAHDAGGFGDSGNDSVVSCGSYTGNGSLQNVNLGWEPQWLLFKRTDTTGNWLLFDSMRGLKALDDKQGALFANLTDAENTSSSYGPAITPTGFSNSNSGTYIYIAIRRGPMKTPTDATKVFGLSARNGTGANATVTGGQLADSVLIKNRGAAVGDLFAARLTGTGYMVTSAQTQEAVAGTTILQANPWDLMDGVKVGTTSTITNASSNTFINYLFRRAPSFFDVVAYAGTGANRTVSHNLGVAPELMIVKTRSGATNGWNVYSAPTTAASGLSLESTSAAYGVDYWNFTAPTASVFSLGTSGQVNASTITYIAYLFASCPGVSKVGSYTGTGTTLSVDCGFTAGARFVLIKRTDSTGDWYVWDSARGIIAGNDPYLLLNSTAAEVTNTDYIDTYSAGFEISSTAPAAINASGGSFIFLAIA